MRLLLVSDHYPPAIGGAERQTRLLAHLFAARGYEVAVAVPWYRGAPRSYDDEGVTVYRVRQLRTVFPALVRDNSTRHAPPFPDPVTVRDLKKLIRQFKPDIVHSHGWITYSCVVALLRNKIPLLVTARDYGYFCANRTLLHDGIPCSGPGLTKCLGCAGRYYGIPKGWIATVGVFANRPLLRRTITGLHSPSSYMSSTMRQHFLGEGGAGGTQGSPEVLEFVIPSFLHEPPEPVPDGIVSAYLEALPSEPFILFVGQFRLTKGINQLIDAYGRIDSPPPLVLIGHYAWDGPSKFPPNVRALTEYPHEAVMAAWDRALFGVMPSLGPEPFGSVVHEGMSRGKPIIGTNHGGHTDMIIDGETGYLVPPGDVDALAAAMTDLIRHPNRCAQFGRAAAKRATLFSAGVVIPQFADAYETIRRRGTGD